MFDHTLMPSLAPSCRYGIIEWFQRSINQDRNSSTVTGQDRKKQGPAKDEGGKKLHKSHERCVFIPSFMLRLSFFIPIRKSDVLCFSRKVCKWYQSLGTQSNTLMRFSLVKFFSSSDSISFLCKYRTRKPLAGSTLLEKVTILRKKKIKLHQNIHKRVCQALSRVLLSCLLHYKMNLT